MARLQRKKTQHAKKKNRDSSASADALGTDRKTGAANVVSGGSDRNSETKQAPPLKSLSFKKRTEPGKIRKNWDKAAQFLREVRVELKKVAWPSRKQTIGSTVVVLILVLIISFFLGAVDVGLASIIRVILQ